MLRFGNLRRKFLRPVLLATAATSSEVCNRSTAAAADGPGELIGQGLLPTTMISVVRIVARAATVESFALTTILQECVHTLRVSVPASDSVSMSAASGSICLGSCCLGSKAADGVATDIIGSASSMHGGSCLGSSCLGNSTAD